MSKDDDPDLDLFINKFGTHAYRKASFGGKAYVTTVYNAKLFSECGIDGAIYLDAVNGYCDKSSSSNTNCQLVNNGQLTDHASCDLTTSLFTERRSFSIGTPKMSASVDLLPHSALDSWMLIAQGLDLLNANKPQIISNVDFYDISLAIYMALV